MNLIRTLKIIVASLTALASVMVAQAQSVTPVQGQTKPVPIAKAQTPLLIRSVTHHEPIPAYLIEAGEKANAADTRGELLLNAADYTRAIDAFHEALSYDPHDGLAYQHLAEAYTAMGQTDRAITAYRTLLYDWPGKGWGNSIGSNTTVIMRFALVLLKAGRRAEALAAYQQGIRWLPTDRGPLPPLFTPPDFAPADFTAAADTAMGIYETAWGAILDAPKYFERAIAIQPTLAVPYFYRGQVLKYQSGRATDALAAFDRAEQLGGPGMEPFVNKAMQDGTAEFKEAVKKAGMTGQQ